jgi:exodeoxyribonuclease VII large subunit
VHALVSRRAFAGWPTRVALHGRHVSELTHHLRGAMRARLAAGERDFRAVRLRLEANDLGRRMAVSRGRLQSAETRLGAAALRARERADARFRVLAGRLENLSPLAVLARGYAVCWNDSRTAIVRTADQTAPGDRVRVTLGQGELACEVLETVDRLDHNQ